MFKKRKKMKRIILLLVAAITVVACGKGDDKNESNTKKFNPPAWIQGTWLDSNNIGYKFEVNDFCVIVPTQEICYNQGIFATEVTDVKEEKTDNTFIDLTTGGGKNYSAPLHERLGFIDSKLKEFIKNESF